MNTAKHRDRRASGEVARILTVFGQFASRLLIVGAIILVLVAIKHRAAELTANEGRYSDDLIHPIYDGPDYLF